MEMGCEETNREKKIRDKYNSMLNNLDSYK